MYYRTFLDRFIRRKCVKERELCGIKIVFFVISVEEDWIAADFVREEIKYFAILVTTKISVHEALVME